MSNWKKVILEKDGCQIKIYVNESDSRAVMFPLFGRYFTFSSDKSALDLATSIIFHIGSDEPVHQNVISYQSYLNSQEDTQIIYQEAA